MIEIRDAAGRRVGPRGAAAVRAGPAAVAHPGEAGRVGQGTRQVLVLVVVVFVFDRVGLDRDDQAGNVPNLGRHPHAFLAEGVD